MSAPGFFPQSQYPQLPQFQQQPTGFNQFPQAQPASSPFFPQEFGQFPQPNGFPQAQRPPLPTGTLDEFYAQPTGGGGPAISWKDAPVGHTYVGVVARDVANSDVRADTDPQGNPKHYRDGRPKFLLVIPLNVQPTQDHPEGIATLWVRGQLRDELQRAMSAAGATGAPKAGDVLQVTFTGTRASRQPGAQPARQFAVAYARDGASPAPAANAEVPATQQPAAAAPVAQIPQPTAPPAPAAQVPAAPVAQPQVQIQQPAAVLPQPASGGTHLPEGLNAEQQALFARLAGGQA